MPKVVLVTGGSSGIGEAIAKLLHATGQYKVYTTSRSSSNGEIKDGIIFLRIDVTDGDSIREGVNYLLGKEQQVDVLINNAGVGFAGPLEHTTVGEISEVFATNVFGVLEMCRAVLPSMRSRGNGLIINISSIGGRLGLPFRGVYSSSKFALEGLSESLSQELKQFGINVVIVEPGGFSTKITEHRKTTVIPEDSVYRGQFDIMYKMVNDDLKKARRPEILAERIREIIESKNPSLRYAVAGSMQKLPLLLKCVLPSRLFEKLVMNHFKIKNR
jgi:NAD(P)-dependent dehydrogenase (short-subunit alcohol dehydrogenase family)